MSITLDTTLGKLPPSVANNIIQRLQINENWRIAAAHLTRRNGKLMHSFMDVELLATYGPNAAKVMFNGLLPEVYTVAQFIKMMSQAELFLISDYLAELAGKVGPPVPQRQTLPDVPPPLPPGRRKSPSQHTLREDPGRQEPTTAEIFRHDRTPSGKNEPSAQDIYINCVGANSERSFNQNYQSDVPHLSLKAEASESSDFSSTAELQSFIFQEGELRHFPYEQLKEMTNKFDSRLKSEGGTCIGEGGYGNVFYARYSFYELAIKKLHNNEMVARRDFDNEKEAMSGLNHENILRLLGYSDDGECICLVYPYMPNGSLEDCLACKWTEEPLSIPKRFEVAQGLADAINYIHTFNKKASLVHRDIKSANVLMDKNYVPKLGDFGISRVFKTTDDGNQTSVMTQVIIGTRAYMAPEWLHFQFSPKSDVYSYGVVLLELLTGLKAYDDKRENPCLTKHVEEECDDMRDKVKMLDSRVEGWPVASAQALYNLATRCLELKPENRPDMKTVLKEAQLA